MKNKKKIKRGKVVNKISKKAHKLNLYNRRAMLAAARGDVKEIRSSFGKLNELAPEFENSVLIGE